MSIDAYHWVLRTAPVPTPSPAGMPATPILKMVLMGLAEHAAAATNWEAFPSLQTLADYTGMSTRSVQRALESLESLGLITPGDPERARPWAQELGLRRSPNVWRLNIESKHDRLSTSDQNMTDCLLKNTTNKRQNTTKTAPKHDTAVHQTVTNPINQKRETRARTKRPAAPATVKDSLSDDWQPKIDECVAASRFDAHGVEWNAQRFRLWAKAEGKTFDDPDAAFLLWLLDEREDAPPRVESAAEVERRRAEWEARDKLLEAQEAERRAEVEARWRARKESQAGQQPDHDVNDPAAVRAHLIAAGYDFGEGATG